MIVMFLITDYIEKVESDLFEPYQKQTINLKFPKVLLET